MAASSEVKTSKPPCGTTSVIEETFDPFADYYRGEHKKQGSITHDEADTCMHALEGWGGLGADHDGSVSTEDRTAEEDHFDYTADTHGRYV